MEGSGATGHLSTRKSSMGMNQLFTCLQIMVKFDFSFGHLLIPCLLSESRHGAIPFLSQGRIGVGDMS